ncbi:proline iminopeptidase-family hydrolase [Corynebacterium variabile]|uniref:proline iminopeptidase-family hydrolase n=1 Tax=Corynebacterium variabile TaxID=1727 RepID=UPI003CBB6A21
MSTVSTGTVTVDGRKVLVRRVTPVAATAPPLVVVHGGPGMTHDYLTDLDRLAELPGSEREVIYYDQAGCGRTARPDIVPPWSLGVFVDELAGLIDALSLDSYDLLGHSAGGWITLVFALRQPAGLLRLVLASTCADMPLYRREITALKDALPDGLGSVIDRCEADGTTNSAEYGRAYGAFQKLHVLRLEHMPDHMLTSIAGLNEEIYGSLLGPEWNMTGSLKEWSVADRLGELDLPVLVTSGRFDEMTPATVRPMVDAIPGALWRIFENSSHMAMMEEPEEYAQVVAAFLGKCLGASSTDQALLQRAHDDATTRRLRPPHPLGLRP